jgi:hypothetical protein
MKRVFGLAGIGAAALAAAALCAPTLQAEEIYVNPPVKRVVASLRSGIGSFTPAAADPRLAAVLAHTGLTETGFRFTPSESRKGTISKHVTLAVRARAARPVDSVEHAAALPETVGLAPIAYNLGVAVGWKRFAVSGEVAHFDLANIAGGRDSVDVGVSFAGKRVSGRLKAGAERPLRNAPRMPGDTSSYSIDVGGAYSLTRNLDVTAGVRYKSQELDRLPSLTQTDERRNSQSVYIGTAFRF